MSKMQKEIESILKSKYTPSHLLVANESDLHKGHAGHDGIGESHFYVEIISEYFLNMSKLEAQREVYTALQQVLTNIHALRLSVKSK